MNAFAPFPGKKPYPNPLDASDGGIDFDGDSLTLAEEHSLWKFTVRNGAAVPTPQSIEQGAAALTYSDGAKYSIYVQGGDDRRNPSLAAVGYDKETDFKNWLQSSGYWQIHRPDNGTTGFILDFDRNGTVSETAPAGYVTSESHYLNRDDRTPYLSDDERDEDADGLSNWDESHGRMTPSWWTSNYNRETPFRLTYAGTDIDNPDSDGDGVRDGADDQDHDDVPNIVELSRNANTGRAFDPRDTVVERPEPGRGPRAAVQPVRAVRRLPHMSHIHPVRECVGALRRPALRARRGRPELPGAQLAVVLQQVVHPGPLGGWWLLRPSLSGGHRMKLRANAALSWRSAFRWWAWWLSRVVIAEQRPSSTFPDNRSRWVARPGRRSEAGR